jgi:hypothetical protein
MARGLDIGTQFIVASGPGAEEEVEFDFERDAYLEVERNDLFDQLLETQDIPFIAGEQVGLGENQVVLVGDTAFKLANAHRKDTKRPLRHGLISPKAVATARPLVSAIIRQLLGPPAQDGEQLVFSVPAAPLDMDMNVDFHRDVLQAILSNLEWDGGSYDVHPIVEGSSVVFSCLGSNQFTGWGISWGAGMTNFSLSYMGTDVLSFSVARGGDWIDETAAKSVGENASYMCDVKERDESFSVQGTSEEAEVFALQSAYRSLIRYVVKNWHQYIASNESDLPRVEDPLPVVISGGTTMVDGFRDVLSSEVSAVDWPLPMGDVTLAGEPFFTVSNGCYISARLRERKVSGNTAPSAQTTME